MSAQAFAKRHPRPVVLKVDTECLDILPDDMYATEWDCRSYGQCTDVSHDLIRIWLPELPHPPVREWGDAQTALRRMSWVWKERDEDPAFDYAAELEAERSGLAATAREKVHVRHCAPEELAHTLRAPRRAQDEPARGHEPGSDKPEHGGEVRNRQGGHHHQQAVSLGPGALVRLAVPDRDPLVKALLWVASAAPPDEPSPGEEAS